MFEDDGYVDQMIGMDMANDGMMQYQQGVILTEMGMPGLGMAQMQMGQMEMAQGQAFMEVGMMENAMGYGTGYGMGYGMGYGTQMGIIAAQQAIFIAERPYICMGIGCTYPCCARRCLPGCQLVCCRKQVIIVEKNYPQQQVNYNSNQGYNNQQYNNRVVYPQQGQQQLYVNNIPGQNYNNQVYPAQMQPQQQAIYSGSIYSQQNFSWHLRSNAALTQTHFSNQSISSINKVKIKRQVAHNDCVYLKTSQFNAVDHVFAVPRHEQINWFCSIINVKMQLSKYNCDLYSQFKGYMEGKIMRKSLFLGEWAWRDIVIDQEGLKSYKNRNDMPTTRIYRIPELWTRFQTIQNGVYLVIKLHHEGSKYEYGIPLQNALHWIKAFYSLMK